METWLRGAPFPYPRGAYWHYSKDARGNWGRPSLVTVFLAPSSGEWMVAGLYTMAVPVGMLHEPRFLPIGEPPPPPEE